MTLSPYHTLSRHTQRRLVVSARRSVGHSVGQTHVEAEPQGPAVQLTAVLPKDWEQEGERPSITKYGL